MEKWSGELFGTAVEVDLDTTRAWYEKGMCWDCDCGHCRNFMLLAKTRQLPETVLEALFRFGIRPEQTTYVCEMHPTEGGHMYQFSYRLAGRMDEDGTKHADVDGGEGYCTHETYPYGAPDFPEPHFDLEFWLDLPWVLDEPDK